MILAQISIRGIFKKVKLLLYLLSLFFGTGVIPPERWIVNFDKDVLDGLVFATVLGAYCPFLVSLFYAEWSSFI